MPALRTLKASDGSTVQFIDERRAVGGLKDVYFSPERDYVVAFYREPLDWVGRERLNLITGSYRQQIFEQAGGEALKPLFCWPRAIVEDGGRVGVVVPFFAPHFFFEHGSRNHDMLGIRRKEKEGKWFASARNRAKFLDPRELGDGKSQMQTCLMVARAVRRLHAAGLAHSDLSYKNVLLDPPGGRACLIDIDGLVVPSKFPPDVAGTPDFFAPEVVKTAHLDRRHPARKLPSRATDQHALAVLIYMNLLFRHPLRGGKVHDADDPQRDEDLAMGAGALFIEHPADGGNRIRASDHRPEELPWVDTQRLPYTLTGPHLARLMQQAFIDGLHEPDRRPTADDWEQALLRTLDLLLPCAQATCLQRWSVFDGSTRPRCPHCGTAFRGVLPVLNLYSSHQEGDFRPDDHRLLVYPGQTLHAWHANRLVAPNERLPADQAAPVGHFVEEQGEWFLINDTLPGLRQVQDRVDVPVGGRVRLQDGAQLLFDRARGGRLAVVQRLVV